MKRAKKAPARPIVVVLVDGGVAEAASFPSGAAGILVIDWDSLRNELEREKEARRLIKLVKALPRDVAGFKDNLITALEDLT